jgi:hypothetical protein
MVGSSGFQSVARMQGSGDKIERRAEAAETCDRPTVSAPVTVTSSVPTVRAQYHEPVGAADGAAERCQETTPRPPRTMARIEWCMVTIAA